MLSEADLRRMIDEDPNKLDQHNDPLYFKELVRFLLAQERWLEAKEALLKYGVIGTPGWPDILFARALDKAGLRDEALLHWREYAKLYPHHPEIPNLLIPDNIVRRPQLTMPPQEATIVRFEYAKARVILEYGSGGSTVLAGENPSASVYSVESDGNWHKMMVDWFERNPPVANLNLVHTDIGPTREWGFPKDSSSWVKFADYPLSVWDMPTLGEPDIVLIDGRFRVGCFLATLISIKKPVRVLFDDYLDRPNYHVVEEFSPRTKLVGRMAVFDMKPIVLSSSLLRRTYSLMPIPD